MALNPFVLDKNGHTLFIIYVALIAQRMYRLILNMATLLKLFYRKRPNRF